MSRPLAPLWTTWDRVRRGAAQAPSAAVATGVPSDPVQIPYSWISPPLIRRPTTAITKAQIGQTGGATATVSASAATVSQYGVNTASIALDTAVDADAFNLATFLTTYESTPRPRQPIVRFILLKRTDDECLTILGVTLGTRVQITGAPTTWPAGATTFVVEGIHHTIATDRREVEWMTSAPVGTTSTGGVLVSAVAGDYASTPDNAVLDIVGDIDLRCDLTKADWTDGGYTPLVHKWDETTNESFGLAIDSSGVIAITWTTGGTSATQVFVSSTVAVPFANGARGAVRATLDVNNGAAGNTATFYTAPTLNGPWTQLGTAVTTAVATSIFSGTAPLEIGTYDVGLGPSTFPLTVHAIEVRDGIDGTVVANPVFSAQTVGTTSFTDDAGRVWTMNGNAQITATTVAPGPWFRWDESYWDSTDVRPF